MASRFTLGRFTKIGIGIILGSLVAFIVLTWLALEAGGVAVVETLASDGSTRSTHVWFVTPDDVGSPGDPAGNPGKGEIWVEAGTPANGWYMDIQERATLALTSRSEARISGRYLARPIPGEAPHRRIRALLREKYGLRDWWIASVFDTSQSVAVRLIPVSSDETTIPTPTPTPTDYSN
jgi:hypothetical protein